MDSDKNSRLLSLQNLSVGYALKEPLVEGINLTVDAGEMIALIGRNGSGKSTLIKTVVGIIPALNGLSFLEGEEAGSLDLRTRAKKVSFVASQVSQVPSISVRELVSLGRLPYTGWRGRMGRTDQEMVEKAVGAVRLQKLIDRPVDHLSDGERQRAMIARALVQDAPLMVLDEPTAFLDIPNRYELIQLLTELRKAGKAVLYSTHDLESAMLFSDKLWVIHHGKVMEGVPEDLGIKGVYDSLFESTGIFFDEELRKFRPAGQVRGSLQLTGDDSRLVAWTRNALERIGYQLNEKAEMKLNVTSSKGSYTWAMSWKDGSAVFENIESMARFLIQEN